MYVCSGGESTQLSYLRKSKDSLIENESSKSESQPVKYYLSKSIEVSGFKCTVMEKVLNCHTRVKVNARLQIPYVKPV